MTTLTSAIRHVKAQSFSATSLDTLAMCAESEGIELDDVARLLTRLSDGGAFYVVCYGFAGDRDRLTIRENDDTGRYCPDGDDCDADYPIATSARRLSYCEHSEFYFNRAVGIAVQGMSRLISPYEYDQENYFTCDTCGDVFPEHFQESSGNCRECENDSTPRLVHDYRANVLDVIGAHCIGDDGSAVNIANRLVFGVELETNTRNASREEIAEALHSTGSRFAELAICKEDGTVSGPEIVTLPATLAAHAAFIPWAQWCEVLNKNNRARPITGDAEVGFHVHVNRAALSPLTIGKLMMFINNDALTVSLWEKLAQRSANRWCSFIPKKWANGLYRSGDRYQALNDTGSGRTLEFRIFRASLRADRILKNIEAVHAAIRYCQNESARQLSGARFLAYVKAQRATYKNLAAFIGEKHISA